MRILVASVPALGHLNPLLPLALRLQAAGDSVVVATAPDVADVAAKLGLPTAPVGPPMGTWFQGLAERTRGRPGDGIPPERTTHWFAPRLFGEVGAPAMVDDLLAVARELRPDVVYYESRCYAAPPVARLVGAPPVLQAVTTLLPPQVETLVGDAVTPMWRQLGLDSPTRAGAFDGLVMSYWPASLDDPSPYGDLVVHRLGPPPATMAPPDWLEPWLAAQDGRPLVYATLGTVFGGNAAPLRAILEGLAQEEVCVLMTLGAAGDPDALGDIPGNARVERYVPQETVLPRCAAVVSHAGSGTTLGALARGVPQVCLPQAADQFINAERCLGAGLGLRLLAAEAAPGNVRDALRAVLADPSFAARARRVGAEMASGISLDQAATLLKGVAARA